MAQTVSVNINPRLLFWARDTAGLNIEEAAKKIGVSESKLLNCEEGSETLSLAQLRKAANAYKRSLGIFFLPEPPETPAELPDFRGLNDYTEKDYSPELRFEIRKARLRRKLALEMYEELGASPDPFNIEARLSDKPEDVGSRIRAWLGVTFDQQKNWSGTYESLNSWLLVLENKYVLVFQTKEVERNEMLGACMHFDTLPAIILNGKYHPNSKVFTLMHELAHLALKRSGVSSQSALDSESKQGDINFLESFCNNVAGEILLPRKNLNDYISSKNFSQIEESELENIARSFGVSREVALRRLNQDSFISFSTFTSLLNNIRASYSDFQSKQTKSSGAPPYHSMVIRDNGLLFTRLVCDAFDTGRISPSEFSSYLGVSLKHADNIIKNTNKKALS